MCTASENEVKQFPALSEILDQASLRRFQDFWKHQLATLEDQERPISSIASCLVWGGGGGGGVARQPNVLT